MIDLSILVENPELAKNIKLEVTGSDLIAFGEWLQARAKASKDKNQCMNEEYLTPKQFAEALQVSLVTLWSWDKKGITAPVRIGNQKRYRKSDLGKF